MGKHKRLLIILYIILCLGYSIFPVYSYAKPGAKKPNIIVIFADDQGYADLGIQGQITDIKTPNLDKLAASGVRMTSGYVTAPQCVPSRAGLLTGRYQQRFGADDQDVQPVPLDEVFLSERLRDAGYVTGMSGKWHLQPLHVQTDWVRKNVPGAGDKQHYEPDDIPLELTMKYLPPARGFQEYISGPMNHVLANYNLRGKSIEQDWIGMRGYRLDNQTNAAISFIDRNHKKPFFFYLAYFGPHVPLEATKKYLSRFPGEMPERRRYCLAMMSAIDDGVGRIIEKLKEYDIYDNTLIFYMSDNGAPLNTDKKDEPLKIQGVWDGSINDPWVGEKGMVSEGGIRIPYIVSWPAVLPKGKVYDRPVISLDMAATAIELAGFKKPRELDGTNLIPYLTGEKSGDPHEALFWRFWDQSAIRIGDWKFLKAGKREFLFDLSSEKHERENLISKHPDTALKMKEELVKWASDLKKPGIPDGEILREKYWYDYYFK